MFLAFFAIYFFETEKLPIDCQASLRGDVFNPERSLVGPWAHRIEVEVDCSDGLAGGHSC